MEKSNRNSLIEILRFVFAFFIIFYHNYFVVDIPIFCNANYAVDFFFVITGMYMTKTIAKYDDLPAVKGGYKLLIDRFIKLGIPLLICYVASIACNVFSQSGEMKIHYLWFIHIMFISYLLFFILWRVFKKDKSYFYFVTYIILFFSAILRFGAMIDFGVPIFNKFFADSYYFDELRGLTCIPIGMFLALIPSINFKNEKKKRIISWTVVIAALVFIIGTLFVSSINVTWKRIIEIIVDLVMFPAILYFAQYISFNNKVLNILGESALYLYIYQSIAALERALNVDSGIFLFASIVIATAITMIWKIEIRKRKATKSISAICTTRL